MSILRTEQLNFTYSPGTPFEHVALRDINLEIEEGSFTGIIGHTGSGKSTLIQHFNGLLQPTSGKIYIDGNDFWADPKDVRKYRFMVGLVFQYPEYQLFEETAAKDIAFGPKNMGLSQQEIDDRVREASESMGIDEELLGKSPFELSGGQKRRVAIAGVLAMRPKVLILDEPTAGLDPQGRATMFEIIKNYHRKMHNTVLLVSHSMEDVAAYAEKVLVMRSGEIFCYDDTDKVFSRGEELLEMGLSVPQVSKVFLELKRRGYPVPDTVYTIEQAKEILLPLLAKGGRI